MATNGASAALEEENPPDSAAMERDSDIEDMDNVKLEKAPKKSALKLATCLSISRLCC